MFKSKKGFILVAVMLLAFSLVITGCGGGGGGGEKKAPAASGGEQKKIVLKLGHEMPENHPYHYGATVFADKVSEKTKGAVTVQIFPNGTLGKQAQLVEGLAMGTVDLSLTNSIVLEKYEPMLGALVLPYVFRDWDHVYKVVDGPIGADLNSRLEKKGIKVLAFHEIGVTNINSIKSIKTPADVKGLKLRVQPGPSFVEVGKALGSVVATTAYGEVYTALQLGTIDAQCQSASNMLANKHYEVAKYFIINDLGFFLEPLSMSKQVFDRLTPDQQKAVMEAGMESALIQRPYARKKQVEDLETMVKNHGLQVTQGKIDEWSVLIEPIHTKFPAWTDLITKIKAIK